MKALFARNTIHTGVRFGVVSGPSSEAVGEVDPRSALGTLGAGRLGGGRRECIRSASGAARAKSVWRGLEFSHPVSACRMTVRSAVSLLPGWGSVF
jgi:hypothetical protein